MSPQLWALDPDGTRLFSASVDLCQWQRPLDGLSFRSLARKSAEHLWTNVSLVGGIPTPGAFHPSEKWWTSSVGIMNFPIFLESHIAAMFQSPPTLSFLRETNAFDDPRPHLYLASRVCGWRPCHEHIQWCAWCETSSFGAEGPGDLSPFCRCVGLMILDWNLLQKASWIMENLNIVLSSWTWELNHY